MKVGITTQVTWFADATPIVGIGTNIVAIFLKCVVFPFLNEKTIHHYDLLTYLKSKTIVQCLIEAVPVLGPIIVKCFRVYFCCLAVENYLPSARFFESENEVLKSFFTKNKNNLEIFKHVKLTSCELTKELMLINPEVFKYAQENVKNNYDTAVWIAKDNWNIYPMFEHVSENIRNNEDLFKNILVHHTEKPFGLRYFKVKEVSENKVKFLFEHMGHTLKNNKDFFLNLKKTYPFIIKYIEPSLIEDLEFLDKIVEIRIDMNCIQPAALKNEQVTMRLAKKFGTEFVHDHQNFFTENPDMLMKVVEEDPSLLKGVVNCDYGKEKCFANFVVKHPNHKAVKGLKKNYHLKRRGKNFQTELRDKLKENPEGMQSAVVFYEMHNYVRGKSLNDKNDYYFPLHPEGSKYFKLKGYPNLYKLMIEENPTLIKYCSPAVFEKNYLNEFGYDELFLKIAKSHPVEFDIFLSKVGLSNSTIKKEFFNFLLCHKNKKFVNLPKDMQLLILANIAKSYFYERIKEENTENSKK